MSESNVTHIDQPHRILILSPKRAADRTSLYIILLLSFLLFILIFYLFYNFISYRHYLSSQKKKMRKRNSCINAEKDLNDRLSFILTQRVGNAYEELNINSYPIKTFYPSQLVSDL
jgi:hypothetical protein